MFRVTIGGTFGELGEEAAAQLCGGAGDVFRIGFTDAGTFTSDASLSAFTFRVQVPAEAQEDGEDEATLRALAALDAYGYPYQVVRVAVTDMREIKIRRKGR